MTRANVSEIVVVKLGGTTLADQAHVLEDVATVARSGPWWSSTAAASA